MDPESIEPSAQTPQDAPHTAGEALGLLALSLILFLGAQQLTKLPGAVAEAVAPALSVLAWIVPAYALVLRRKRDPFVAHGLLVRPKGLGLAVGVSALLLGLYVLALFVVRGVPPHAVPWGAALTLLGNHLLIVALPEEYFFRGVLQPALDGPNGPRWRLLGAPFGKGAVIASALFALCHFVRVPGVQFVAPSVYTLLIFFPALWFAWLRARTKSIVPGIVAHALANAFELACLTAWGL